MPRAFRLAWIWIVVAGCSRIGPTDVYFPTYGPMNGGPLALVEATLVEDDGCLWIQSTDTRWLMLWPRGSTVTGDSSQRVVFTNGQGVPVGSQVRAGGGEYGDEHYEFVVRLIGQPIPEQCRASDNYWLGSDIRALEP